MAEPVVVVRSFYDKNWWIIEGKSVRKLEERELDEIMANCRSFGLATYCSGEGTLLVWSRRGNCAVGLKGVNPEDPDAWCNVSRLAELLKDRLPEPIMLEDIYASAALMTLNFEEATSAT